jgi:hypothetical protein
MELVAVPVRRAVPQEALVIAGLGPVAPGSVSLIATLQRQHWLVVRAGRAGRAGGGWARR